MEILGLSDRPADDTEGVLTATLALICGCYVSYPSVLVLKLHWALHMRGMLGKARNGNGMVTCFNVICIGRLFCLIRCIASFVCKWGMRLTPQILFSSELECLVN